MRRLLLLLLFCAAPAYAASDRPPNLKAGIAALERADYARARLELERAMVANPRNPDSYHQLGRAHAGLGDDGKALKYFALALQLDPNHAGALRDKGRALLRQGDREAAGDVLRRLTVHCDGCAELRELRRAIER